MCKYFFLNILRSFWMAKKVYSSLLSLCPPSNNTPPPLVCRCRCGVKVVWMMLFNYILQPFMCPLRLHHDTLCGKVHMHCCTLWVLVGPVEKAQGLILTVYDFIRNILLFLFFISFSLFFFFFSYLFSHHFFSFNYQEWLFHLRNDLVKMVNL